MKEQDLVEKKRKKEIEKERAKVKPKKAAKNDTSAKGNGNGNGKDAEKGEASREALKLARREEAMDKNNIRLVSIGQDRFHNRYWYWNALYGRLFVERPAVTSSTSKQGQTTTAASWGYYSTKGELDSLLEFLDARGIREIELKAAIEKKYNKMIAAMDKRSNEIATAATVTEVRRSSRIKTTRVDKEMPSFMNYVNKFT